MMTAREHASAKINENLKQYRVSYARYALLCFFCIVCTSAVSLICWPQKFYVFKECLLFYLLLPVTSAISF